MSATIRIADYPQVKAVIDAAQEVVDAKKRAEWDWLWTVSRQIDRLQRRLETLNATDKENTQ